MRGACVYGCVCVCVRSRLSALCRLVVSKPRVFQARNRPGKRAREGKPCIDRARATTSPRARPSPHLPASAAWLTSSGLGQADVLVR
ncbi:hypothetical protein PoB_001609200 [Plakobranchus ocellatus]|uniref:Secreted protein n=1 Tax=Plakobranchus ocellatus TaxID=259542 RepID=A0AAV3Z4Y6_9GAST|nr:hypothetical protein PoB_001609200 [Plakobranchus ocellatus]